MSEFKFTCPNCQQNIQVTPEYSGLQIQCPACQSQIVVPQAPGITPPAAAPGGKLTKAPSTAHQPVTSPAMMRTVLVSKKKPKIGLYVGLGVGALAVAAGIYWGPSLYQKAEEHHEATVKAEEAATNPPVQPPPELTADQILKKTAAAYKALTSYSADGQTEGTLDLSAISPSKKPQTYSATSSILLARSGNYRIEWDRKMGTIKSKGAVWSAGQGDFIRNGTSATKMKNREAAMGSAASLSGTLGSITASLFFDDQENLANAIKNAVRTNSETMDGEKCYVVVGQLAAQNALLWINRTNFLIAKVEIILGGKVDEVVLDKLTPAQKAQIMAALKVKGNFVETYDNVEVNKNLDADAFQKGVAPGMKLKPKHPKDPNAPARRERAPT